MLMSAAERDRSTRSSTTDVSLTSESFSFEFPHVAVLQIAPLVAAETDPSRRFGRDFIARLEDHDVAQTLHDVVETMWSRPKMRLEVVADCTLLSFSPRLSRRLAGISDLAEGRDPWAERIEGLGRLALDPLTTALKLASPFGHIVGEGGSSTSSSSPTTAFGALLTIMGSPGGSMPHPLAWSA